MGLIKAAVGGALGVLSDQWKEYFYCEALPADVLVAKGVKRGRHGTDNIISSGSVIAVADGQCMMIVEQGQVVELCAEPGEFTFDASTEPSIFSGSLGEGLGAMFQQICKRFTFGGAAPKDQRIYYFNTKEILGNKYGTPNAIPFRVVDQRAGIDIDVSVRCFGEYSYKLTNPMLFYTNVCGNVSDIYTRDELDSQLKSEFLTALQPAFARISEMGIRYSALPGHTLELSDAMREALSAKWRDFRGIEVAQVGVNSVTASPEDEAMLKELQRNAAFMNPAMAAAHLAASQGDAMKTAAANKAGAANAFFAMNMANQAGGVNAQQLYQMAAQQQPAAPVQPAAQGWTCSCGAVNQGKFCPECGAPKPAGALQYRCDKCGWTVPAGQQPPKFCPECGDPFDNNDIVG